MAGPYPAELTSLNAVAAMLENAGALAGPLLAGGVLVLADAPLSMALAAGFSRPGWPFTPWSGGSRHASLRGQGRCPGGAGRGGRPHRAGPDRRARRRRHPCLRADLCPRRPCRSHPGTCREYPALGQSAVGWLTAAIGAGGLVGGAAAAGLVHVTRLGRAFVAGLLLWGLPLVWLALTPNAAVAFLALVVVGVGNAIEDVGLFTCWHGPRALVAGGGCSVRLSS